MTDLTIIEGDGPLILGQPHGGTDVPEAIAARLNERGRGLTDTDWHIARLYDGLLPGASVVRTPIHRYVVDANRDPSGLSLYPGQNTTGLVPLTDFDGHPIWREGQEPGAEETKERRALYHAPYHAALAAQIERVRAKHGFAILYDCHSIRSDIPFLFEGRLPVFNIGTDNGSTCAPDIERVTQDICTESGESTVVNGRFKGGWTTRHCGRPRESIHAIQMELAQRAYMDEAPPWSWREDRAAHIRPILGRILETLVATLEKP